MPRSVLRHVPAIWRDRHFMLFWGGQTVSILGSSMSGLAFPLIVLALTGKPALAGVAGALRAAPFALLALPAGALVDRWDRKRVLICCDAARALALGSIPVAWWLGHLTLVQLYVATTVEGAMLVFYHTAHMAALPQLVPPEHLATASAQEEGAYYAVTLLGPPAGGALYQIGPALPFLADALSYLVSVLSLLLVGTDLRRAEQEIPRRLGVEIWEGLAWLWHAPLIHALSLLDVPETLVSSGIGLLVVVLAEQQHTAPATIGTIFSIAGAGGLLGAVVGAQVQKHFPFGLTMIGLRWLVAALWPLYAIAPNPVVLGIITAGLFFLNPVKNVAVVSYSMPLIPAALRGRIVGLWDLLPAATSSLGAALMGVGLQSLGSTATVLIASALMLLLALAVSLNAHIRNAPRPAAG